MGTQQNGRGTMGVSHPVAETAERQEHRDKREGDGWRGRERAKGRWREEAGEGWRAKASERGGHTERIVPLACRQHAKHAKVAVTRDIAPCLEGHVAARSDDERSGLSGAHV